MSASAIIVLFVIAVLLLAFYSRIKNNAGARRSKQLVLVLVFGVAITILSSSVWSVRTSIARKNLEIKLYKDSTDVLKQEKENLINEIRYLKVATTDMHDVLTHEQDTNGFLTMKFITNKELLDYKSQQLDSISKQYATTKKKLLSFTRSAEHLQKSYDSLLSAHYTLIDSVNRLNQTLELIKPEKMLSETDILKLEQEAASYINLANNNTVLPSVRTPNLLRKAKKKYQLLSAVARKDYSQEIAAIDRRLAGYR